MYRLPVRSEKQIQSILVCNKLRREWQERGSEKKGVSCSPTRSLVERSTWMSPHTKPGNL